MKKFLAILGVAFTITGCGGGDSDSGFFWDGFINNGLIQWRCRDASNGQFAITMACSNEKVNDNRWPTDGVPRETNLWARGVPIQTVCRDQMAAFPNASFYSRVNMSDLPKFRYQGRLIKLEYDSSLGGILLWSGVGYLYQVDKILGMSEIIEWQNFWNSQNDTSIVWKKDNSNWIVWLIQAPRSNTGIYPAKCAAYSMENGVFKGLRVF